MTRALCVHTRTQTQTTILLTVCAWCECNVRIVVTIMVKFNGIQSGWYAYTKNSNRKRKREEEDDEEVEKMNPFVSDGSLIFLMHVFFLFGLTKIQLWWKHYACWRSDNPVRWVQAHVNSKDTHKLSIKWVLDFYFALCMCCVWMQFTVSSLTTANRIPDKWFAFFFFSMKTFF